MLLTHFNFQAFRDGKGGEDGGGVEVAKDWRGALPEACCWPFLCFQVVLDYDWTRQPLTFTFAVQQCPHHTRWRGSKITSGVWRKRSSQGLSSKLTWWHRMFNQQRLSSRYVKLKETILSLYSELETEPATDFEREVPQQHGISKWKLKLSD